MARKRLIGNLAALKQKDDNFFSLPEKYELNHVPGGLTKIKAAGLKPNTRYKVMLDNKPGQQFEDVTDFSLPIGESIKNNLHRAGNRGILTYLKTDDAGKLDLTVMNFGGDAISTVGTPTAGQRSAVELWKQYRQRSKSHDKGREKIKLIEYSQVNNPDSDSRIKTVKFQYNSSTIDDEANIGDDALPPGIIADATLPKTGKHRPRRQTETTGAFYQTFFINSRLVGGSKTVDITDVVLYLRRKPGQTGNRSGRKNPGINVILLECNADGSPNISARFEDGVARAEWHETKASPLAASGTRFEFDSPVTVDTNKSYALCIQPEDEEYIFWYSQKGDLLLVNGNRSEQRSGGSSKEHQGDYYPARTSASRGAVLSAKRERPWQPDTNLDLKFDVNIAEYNIGDVSVNFIHKDYEFIQLVYGTDDNWMPGEWVYKDKTADSTGISITAGQKVITGTGMASVNDGDKLVVIDGTDSTIVQIFTVDTSIAAPSSTKIYVEEYCERTITNGSFKNTVIGRIEVYDFDFKFMRLNDSSVNVTQYDVDNTKRFWAADTIIGHQSGSTGTIDYMDTLDVSIFRTAWNGDLPTEFDATSYYKFAESVGGGVYELDDTTPNMYLNAVNNVDYTAEILSKSIEVDQSTNMHNASSDSKSSILNLSFVYNGQKTKVYNVPAFEIDELQVVAHRFAINNDSTNEHTNDGNAITKHISKKLEFDGQRAEDIRVIINAYRPRQTEIEIYAKILNSDDPASFDDKYWTKLTNLSSIDDYSSSLNRTDYREYEYGFPFYPPSATTLSGEYTATLDSAVLTTTSGTGTDVSAGDVIKIYSPIFSDNYGVFSVETSDAGSITLNEPVSNTSIAQDGLKIDTLTTPYTAFKNIENDDIVRYFGVSGESYDNYDTVAIKIVLLAEDRKLTPKVDDYRVIGVSA